MSSSRGTSPKAGHATGNQFDEVVQRIGPPPDLSGRFYLKYRYGIKQRKYLHAVKVNDDLKRELGEKESKVQRLQDEIDLILSQLHANEYAHLQPKHDQYFSDDDAAEDDDDDDDEEDVENEDQAAPRPITAAPQDANATRKRPNEAPEPEGHEAKRIKS